MRLDQYLARIGYDGPVRADPVTLFRIHRAHALSVPFENFGVQLREGVTRDADAAFEKIVGRRRGGWCYENNGLMAAVLEEIGFRVERMTAAVGRDLRGDAVVGNHLTLFVTIDGRRYLCDVGFGDGPLEPRPLVDGAFANGPLDARIGTTSDGWRRYSCGDPGSATAFDFRPGFYDDARMAEQHGFLRDDSQSPFVLAPVAMRWRDGEHLALRGRRLTRRSAAGKSTEVIEEERSFVATLRDLFGLDIPEAANLWPRILARDAELFSERND
jgi:N-hydroxyarylamine O-acetyltransferase